MPTVARLPECLPGMSFKREAKKWSSQCALLVEIPFRAVKEAVVSSLLSAVVCCKLTISKISKASGSAIESVASSLIHENGEDGSLNDEDVAKKATAAMYLGKSVLHDIPHLYLIFSHSFLLVGGADTVCVSVALKSWDLIVLRTDSFDHHNLHPCHGALP